jgi:hypothetical protein
MVKTVKEVVSKKELNIRDPAQVAWMQQKKQRKGVGEQLQEKVWDPRGFQQIWEAHEFS